MTIEEQLHASRKPIKVLAFGPFQFEMWAKQYKLHPKDVQRIHTIPQLDELINQSIIVMLPIWYRSDWCRGLGYQIRQLIRHKEIQVLEFEEWDILGITEQQYNDRRRNTPTTE